MCEAWIAARDLLEGSAHAGPGHELHVLHQAVSGIVDDGIEAQAEHAEVTEPLDPAGAGREVEHRDQERPRLEEIEVRVGRTAEHQHDRLAEALPPVREADVAGAAEVVVGSDADTFAVAAFEEDLIRAGALEGMDQSRQEVPALSRERAHARQADGASHPDLTIAAAHLPSAGFPTPCREAGRLA